MQLNTRKLAGLLAALVLASRAFGFGGEGHQIVALIAENHLKPEAQKQVHELLDGANISDAEVASWADQVRDDRQETRQWHFVNIPVDANGFDRKRDGNHGDNVIDKIVDFTNILADKSKSKKVRAEALKFLVHFVGDAHQPLHCADRKDAGGNTCMVSIPDEPKPLTLHFLWDTKMIRLYIGMNKIADYANGIDKRIPKGKIDAIGGGKSVDWANESQQIAARIVYKGINESGQTPLDNNYIKNSKPIIEEQLAKGGIRLAKILNDVLK